MNRTQFMFLIGSLLYTSTIAASFPIPVQKDGNDKIKHIQQNKKCIRLRWHKAENDEWLDVPESAIKHSETLTNLVKDVTITENSAVSVPIYNISRETLQTVIDCLVFIDENNSTLINDIIKPLSNKLLLDLMCMADYLDIKLLFELCTIQWASRNTSTEVLDAYETNDGQPIIQNNKDLPDQISSACAKQPAFRTTINWLRQLIEFKDLTYHFWFSVRAVGFSPDDTCLILYYNNNTIYLLDLTTNTLSKKFFTLNFTNTIQEILYAENTRSAQYKNNNIYFYRTDDDVLLGKVNLTSDVYSQSSYNSNASMRCCVGNYIDGCAHGITINFQQSMLEELIFRLEHIILISIIRRYAKQETTVDLTAPENKYLFALFKSLPTPMQSLLIASEWINIQPKQKRSCCCTLM